MDGDGDIRDVLTALRHQQERVGLRVGRLTDAGWEAGLQPMGLERLVQLGHFPAHPWELDWSPREVVGHLRDSARVFTRRINRIRTEDRPRLSAFTTDAPARVQEYGRTPVDELSEQFEQAQQDLIAAVEAVEPDELRRVAVHEERGEVMLGELLAALPTHQRDHAEQLAALTAESLA